MEVPEPILLERMLPGQRVDTALETWRESSILTTSFGIQSAVLLHLVTSRNPKIPVVFIDTGFLFPETLEFAENLTKRLDLNLKTYRSDLGAEDFIAQHGKLWEQGAEGLEQYNRIVKVEPLERALTELKPKAWFSGLRRSQSRGRAQRNVIEEARGVWKIYPVIDWSDRDVYQYLKKYDLPYHPLWEKGYTSVGDIHSSAPLGSGTDEESTRFGGMKRECGLHDNTNSDKIS